jgi:deoxyribodipyrimidine photolyase-related protein
MTSALRNLILILGDQLDADSAAFDGFEAARDGVWMAEVREEATHVWSHKARIAVFLAAMRHFAAGLRGRGWDVRYRAHGAHAAATLADALKADLAVWRPERVIMVLAGDGRVDAAIRAVCVEAGVPIEVREDRHFYATPEQFATWANGRRELRLEWFYRDLRKRHRVLMDGAKPATGQWNYDHDNRNGFGAQGPGFLPAPRRFVPDAITREVLDLVARDYAEHPGDLDTFDWPVTAEAAEAALQDFLAHRLPAFGQWQDAMWSGEPWLYHSRLSAAMNLKLLPAKRVVDAVEAEYRAGRVPIAAAEGFIRQILGWREYVRGLYWWRLITDQRSTHAPCRMSTGPAIPPELHGADDRHTLRHGYAHHIQRRWPGNSAAGGADPPPKMVPGCLHRRLEWVELPNTLGMASLPTARHGQQALHRQRQVHRPPEQLLSRLPLQTRPDARRRGLSDHHAVLGLPAPPPRPLQRPPAPRPASPQPRPLRSRHAGGVAGASGFGAIDQSAPARVIAVPARKRPP